MLTCFASFPLRSCPNCFLLKCHLSAESICISRVLQLRCPRMKGPREAETEAALQVTWSNLTTGRKSHLQFLRNLCFRDPSRKAEGRWFLRQPDRDENPSPALWAGHVALPTLWRHHHQHCDPPSGAGEVLCRK